MKNHNLIDPNSSENICRTNTKKPTLWHVIIRLLKIKDKEKILGTGKQKQKQKSHNDYREATRRRITDFISENK